MEEVKELHFHLVPSNDWPPVAVEGVLARPSDGGYEIISSPLFIKHLAVSDRIKVIEEDAGMVTAWESISQSPNSTVWILRQTPSPVWEPLISAFEGLGCQFKQLTQVGIFSVSVPGTLDFAKVDEILDGLDPDMFAVAFPALRHPDN